MNGGWSPGLSDAEASSWRPGGWPVYGQYRKPPPTIHSLLPYFICLDIWGPLSYPMPKTFKPAFTVFLPLYNAWLTAVDTATTMPK